VKIGEKESERKSRSNVKRREHMDRGEWSVKGRKREHMNTY
jgi:hypothetical protein